MSELNKRILTAIPLALLAIGWMFYLPEVWFPWISALFGLLATHELLVMLRLRPGLAYFLTGSLCWGLLAAGVTVLAVVLVAILCWTMLGLKSARPATLHDDVAGMLMAQWMLLWLMLFIAAVINLHAMADGMVFLSGAFVGIWASDIGAYFTGKAFGKRKLCPAISPGKSWEGFFGGLLSGCLASGLIWHAWLDMPWPITVLLGLVLVVCGVLGDLAESMVKRMAGVKDSGTILPGHGGILDRVDALLPAIPATGLLWMVIQ